MDIQDVTDKSVDIKSYTEFSNNSIDYRYHDTGKGFLIEKRLPNQELWIIIGTAENQEAVNKYFSILLNTPPGMDNIMRDRLLNAIVSGDSINDMLKKNRKRSNPLLEGLMKRM